MSALIPLLILLFPIAEVFVLIKVSAIVGGWNTFFLLIFMGVWGSTIARYQGMAVINKMQQSLNRGEAPSEGLLGECCEIMNF